MTGHEKAALLLNNLAPRVTDVVLNQLGAEQGGFLRAELQRLQKSPPPVAMVDQMLAEFDALLDQLSPAMVARTPEPALPPQGLGGYASFAPPAKGFPAGRERRPTNDTPPISQEDLAHPLETLRQLPAEPLAGLLHGEQARTVALIMNTLTADQAGEVLKRLPPPVRREVAVQLGDGVTARPEVLQRIAKALLGKSGAANDKPAETESKTRFKRMAEILRLLEDVERGEILTALEEHDSSVAAAIKAFLYHFEDLLRIDDRSMQKLLSEIDLKTLALALKNAPDSIRDKILRNLSQRAQEMLEEELEFLGAVPAPQVKQAQKQVVEVIQRLDQAGELVMLE